jgi:hypothetical protein
VRRIYHLNLQKNKEEVKMRKLEKNGSDAEI